MKDLKEQSLKQGDGLAFDEAALWCIVVVYHAWKPLWY